MKLTLLGTGTPEAHLHRASSGYLLEIGADKILLDCGGGVYDRLVQAGLLPSDITHLFFTHLHSDHMIDYPRLVHGAWDEGGAPLHVWGPAPIAQITERYFGTEGALAHDLIARTQLKGSQEVWVARGGTLPRPWPAPVVTEITPGWSQDFGDWRITSCEVPHAQPYLTCMAFRVDGPSGSVVYSGDAGPSAELDAMAAGADLMLHWCYRLASDTANAAVAAASPTAAEIAAMAGRIGVRHLLLTHLRKHMDAPGRNDEMLAEAQGAFAGTVEIAEDLKSFTFPLPG